MKLMAIVIVAGLVTVLSGCEGTSLEQIVEKNHQQRIDEANAGRPVAKGARDGVGVYSDTKRLTLSADGSSE